MAELPESKYIWMNGEKVAWANATVHVLAHGLHYGTAVFEGIRCYRTDSGSEVFRLDDHMRRLVGSADMIGMPLPFSAEELVAASVDLIRANDLRSCYVRPIAFRGYGALGVNPRPAPVDVAIAVWPWDAYLGPEALEAGVTAGISSWRQRSANATPGAVKSSASYLNSGLAHMEAIDHGYGEAILLNETGMVAEGSGENIFVVRDGRLTTPPLSDGILSGITRNSIIKLARDCGYQVDEASLLRTDLYTADEVFFTGTAAEVTPISAVDGRKVGSGRRGRVTTVLQERFFDVVCGKVPEYEAWMHRIEW